MSHNRRAGGYIDDYYSGRADAKDQLAMGRECKAKRLALRKRRRRTHRRRDELYQCFPRAQEDIKCVAPNLRDETAFEVCEAVWKSRGGRGLLRQGERRAASQVIGIELGRVGNSSPFSVQEG